MSATEIQIADAVVAELNAASWSLAFTAARTYLPVYSQDDLVVAGSPVLKVAVVPLSIADQKQHARGSRRLYRYGLAIDIQQKILVPQSSGGTTIADGLAALVESVQQFYQDRHTLATLPAWRALESDRESVYDLEAMYQENRFWSFVAVEFEGWR